MGLDNYALRGPDREFHNGELGFCNDKEFEVMGFEALTDDDIEAFKQADIQLCGGVLSGAEGSFRGKVYVLLVLDITNESLYQEWIPPKRVKKMYEALMNCDPKTAVQRDYVYAVKESTIINLRKFFRVCAERNLGLTGWS
jgi:hypothetical protein